MQLFSVCGFWSPLLICIWGDDVSKNPMLLEFTFKFPMKSMLISDHKYFSYEIQSMASSPFVSYDSCNIFHSYRILLYI
jgi:hypothetical protein